MHADGRTIIMLLLYIRKRAGYIFVFFFFLNLSVQGRDFSPSALRSPVYESAGLFSDPVKLLLAPSHGTRTAQLHMYTRIYCCGPRLCIM